MQQQNMDRSSYLEKDVDEDNDHDGGGGARDNNLSNSQQKQFILYIFMHELVSRFNLVMIAVYIKCLYHIILN